MRPLPFVWPHALVFWAVYIWAFSPEWKVVQGGVERAGDDERGERRDGGRRDPMTIPSGPVIVKYGWLPFASLGSWSSGVWLCRLMMPLLGILT